MAKEGRSERRGELRPPPLRPAKTPGSLELLAAPSTSLVESGGQSGLHTRGPGSRRRWPAFRSGSRPPQPVTRPGAEPRSGGLRASGVCVCLSLRAGVPKCRRQPVYVGPVLAWQAPGAGRLSLGSWRIARSLRAAGSGGNRPGAPGSRAPQGWDEPGVRPTQFAFLVGARSSECRRVWTAGFGPRRGQGLPAAGTDPGGSRDSASSWALSSLPGSRLRAPRACWCSNGGSVQGLTVPWRASMWVQGAGACVSVGQCVARAVLWD